MKRWLRRGLKTIVGLLVLFGLFVGWALLFCFAEPPELDYEPVALGYAPPSAPGPDGRVHFGPNWFLPQKGRSLLSVEGDPFSLGYANATLTREFLAEQERSLFETVEQFFPNRLGLYGIGLVVLVGVAEGFYLYADLGEFVLNRGNAVSLFHAQSAQAADGGRAIGEEVL